MKKLLLKVLELGASGFGGMAILGFIKDAFVKERKDINESQFYEGLSISQFIPGTTAGNLISYIGYKIGKSKTMFLMQIAFLLPAIISMFLLTYVYTKFGEVEIIKNIFIGINITVVVLLIKTMEKIFKPFIKNWRYIFMMVISFLLKIILKLNVFEIMFIILILNLLLDNGVYENEDRNVKININPKEFIIEIIFMIVFIISFIFRDKDRLIMLFYNMGKIGFFTFGGGVAAISMIQDIIVKDLGWLNSKEFLTGISLSQMTPGPILNIAVFIGYKVSGIIGGIVAAIGMFTPGVLLMHIFSTFGEKFLEKSISKKIINGILLGFNGIILSVILKLFQNSVTNIKEIIFFVIIFVIAHVSKAKALKLILISGILSYVYFGLIF
ncbi:chromate efflux transporter [Haliovirga abyssi]|uniref:Chromate transporter n=1 Tax=Haliovirga abyssi TaxID=2996794 RepID=A0AAU9D8C9_9FUSO|nr:chromate efflux transporter [Haliovirga abyssi]BDU49836.1 hypothetical protein HLVA_04050 [Haliovirga abyssi]